MNIQYNIYIQYIYIYIKVDDSPIYEGLKIQIFVKNKDLNVSIICGLPDITDTSASFY